MCTIRRLANLQSWIKSWFHKHGPSIITLSLGVLVVACIAGDAWGEADGKNDRGCEGCPGAQENVMVLTFPDALNKKLATALDAAGSKGWLATLAPFLPGIAIIIGAGISFWAITRAATATFANNRKLYAEQEKYKRVSAQLNEFYGPLHAINCASRRSWEVFCEKYNRYPKDDKLFSFLTHNYKGEEFPIEYLQGEENVKFLVLYMRVMQTVFEPLNRQREELVLRKAALIEFPNDQHGKTNRLPKELVDLVAHVSELRSVVKRWDKFRPDAPERVKEWVAALQSGTTIKDEFATVFPFPQGIVAYAEERFNQLRESEEKLYKILTGEPPQ